MEVAAARAEPCNKNGSPKDKVVILERLNDIETQFSFDLYESDLCPDVPNAAIMSAGRRPSLS
jgi:hypothetical protein